MIEIMGGRKRVLHINCNYIENALHQLMIENLDLCGYENQVFVPTYDMKLSAIVPNQNVCICECFRKWDRLFFAYKQQKIRKRLEVNINIASYELIHAYTLFTDGNCARWLSMKYGIPYIVAVRNTDVNIFFRFMPHLRKRGCEIMRGAAAVFFLSEEYRRQVFEKYIPSKYKKEIWGKTHIIPNGIDNFWLENTPESEKRIDKKSIKLLYVGRIDRNKNITTTQKAMEILRTQGYITSLTIVGNVWDKREYQIIKKNYFTECLPAMKKEELIKAYRESDIFVMPSYTESFGLVYAEAMSQGLPVVYSKGQGFDNQFSEGIVGYHVNANDPKDVADGIRRVVDSFSEIQKNVISAAKTFDWRKIVEKYDHVYRMTKARN